MVPTLRGILLAVCGFIPIVLWQSWVTLVICTVGCAILLLADVLATPRTRRLAVTRQLPSQVSLGNTIHGQLLITNPTGRTLHLLLRDAWNPTAGINPHRAALTIPARERRAVSQEFTPTRRGMHSSHAIGVWIRGPLGLTRRTGKLTVPGTLIALHPFASRRHLPSRLRRLREIEGLSAVHTRGQGTEFDSLRDFVDGDDVRSIDWRATARRRHVVVRTWRPERDRRILIVVDTSRTSAVRIGDVPRFDALLDAALLLTALAIQAGDRVDLIGVDRITHLSVSGSSPSTVLSDMVHATASVQPALVETNWDLVAREVERRTRPGTLVVLLTGLDVAAAENGVLAVTDRIVAHHPVIVASAKDPVLDELSTHRDDIDQVYRAASAEIGLHAREVMGEMLMRRGCLVADKSPDDLPCYVADLYIALKAQGKL
ncbi:DUF58 domain-containing protein [Devriesea agamarum]|uniref:DUF58 domain-containing protein n=1 Tax=Devriesea agamarum TaxID=472569 RepID=UPI00071D3886|nr:DUF58 domain-containing protein [Devriesea agamarum]